jgi:hypothetical protein
MRRIALRIASVLLAAAAIGIAGCTAQETPAVRVEGPAVKTIAAPAPAARRPATGMGSLVASLPPLPGPGEWVGEVTNPWFPYKSGTTFVYKGMKDGEPTVDTFAVTKRKKLIQGVQATVVMNTTRTSKGEVEGTEEWFAQDKRGNVWYLGELTQEFDASGKSLGTSGSSQAGKAGAKAGLFMPADPMVGDTFFQEYLKGVAEDAYRIISMDGTVTVPYGTYTHVLITEDTTALEPDVATRKYYVKGVGEVYEANVKGPVEYSKLVEIKKG